MRIRGSGRRWALPPDVESSTHQTLPPLRHPQPYLQPSLPSSKNSKQDDLISTGEDEDTENPVAATPRKYDCNPSSEIAADADSSISSSSSHVGRWPEEDKALPLKKRRLVQVDMKGKEPCTTTTERELKNSNETRAKRKRTAKIWTDYVLQVEWVADKECHKTRNMNERCNRRNGKGWRCSLPAVAGHNLCEHHWTEQKKSTRRRA